MHLDQHLVFFFSLSDQGNDIKLGKNLQTIMACNYSRGKKFNTECVSLHAYK